MIQAKLICCGNGMAMTGALVICADILERNGFLGYVSPVKYLF